MPDCSEDEFNERLDRAFDPENHTTSVKQTFVDGGPKDDQDSDETTDQLDDLENVIALIPIPILDSLAEINAARDEAEVIPVLKDYICRYDRQYLKVKSLEEELSGLTAGSERHHSTTSELAEAKQKLKTESKNATDNKFREREEIDEWRATSGRGERNESRRDRAEPNQMTPKHVLTNETPEETKDRVRKANTDQKRKSRAKKKAAKTEEK
jgi:hypothetical protein